MGPHLMTGIDPVGDRRLMAARDRETSHLLSVRVHVTGHRMMTDAERGTGHPVGTVTPQEEISTEMIATEEEWATHKTIAVAKRGLLTTEIGPVTSPRVPMIEACHVIARRPRLMSLIAHEGHRLAKIVVDTVLVS